MNAIDIAFEKHRGICVAAPVPGRSMLPATRATLALTIPLLMMIGGFTDELSAPATSRGTPTAMVAPRSTEAEAPQLVEWSDDTTHPDTDAEPALDLFGNEVTVAVAEYKLDAVGRLYEAHAPQSELPRLGSPKS